MSKILQLGEVLCDIPIFGNNLKSVAKKGTDIARNLGKKVLDKQIDRFNKEYITGLGITLTYDEIKGIMKVIKCLEHRGILLKELLEKVLVKKEDF